MEIRVLARQGMSIRAIAQQLRVSRNTVRKYLRNPGLPIYPSRAVRPTKLDPFKPYLQARIQAAKPHWIPATVLLRELREHGYTGGLSQLKAWLSPLRHDASGTIVRFETDINRLCALADTGVIRAAQRNIHQCKNGINKTLCSPQGQPEHAFNDQHSRDGKVRIALRSAS